MSHKRLLALQNFLCMFTVFSLQKKTKKKYAQAGNENEKQTLYRAQTHKDKSV